MKSEVGQDYNWGMAAWEERLAKQSRVTFRKKERVTFRRFSQ